MSNFIERKAVFKGMTLDQMKKAYSKMTAKERGQYAGAFVRAAKTAKKPTKGSSGQRSTTTKSTKPAPVQPAKNKGNTGSGRDGRPGTGTHGSLLPSNPQLKSQTKPKPKSKVQKAVSEFAKRNFQKGKMYGEDVKPTSKKGKFASRDMAKGKMYGKPKRSDYPSGRAGTAQYLAALRKFRNNAPPSTPRTRTHDKRGRPLF